MKKLLTATAFLLSLGTLQGQELSEGDAWFEGELFETSFDPAPSMVPSIGPTSELGIIQKSLRDMFDFEILDVGLPKGIQDNPPPPVPLDGGIIALLLAGGAAGYKRFRTRSIG